MSSGTLTWIILNYPITVHPVATAFTAQVELVLPISTTVAKREFLEEFIFLVLLVATLFLFGFVVPEAHSQPVIGQDTLALMQKNFQWKNYNAETRALSVLDWTFGDDFRAVENALRETKPAYFRVHLVNTTCVRNGNCGPYEPVAGYTVASLDRAVLRHDAKLIEWVQSRTRLYRDLASHYPATTFLVSPALEHNLSKDAWRILADTVVAQWPGVQLVNSPEKLPVERYRGSWIEGHGALAPTYVDINSLDGQDATDIAIAPWMKRFTNIKVLYVWSRGYNCRNTGPWEDPRARTSCPTRATAELLAHITDARGAPPRPLSSCKPLPFKSPDIWKPLAEDKGTGDPRANLPVLILTAAKTKVEVVRDDGRVAGFLAYYGPYKGTQNRYYSGQIGSGQSGYQLSKDWAYLRQGKKCWGPLITGRRQGQFHD